MAADSTIVQVLKILTQLDAKGLDEAKAKLGEVAGEADKGSGKLGNLAGAAGKAAVGLGAIGATGLIASIGIAGNFEKSLQGVAAATGASTEELSLLRKEALSVGKDTSLSASQAVEAFGELAKAGIDTKDIVGGVGRTTVQLAEATGTSVSQMATLLADTKNQFGLSLEEMGGAADTFAKVAAASTISVADIQESMKGVGPVAADLGISLEDTTKAIGLLGNQGVKGAEAGTALRGMLLRLTAPTDAAKAALDDLGVSVFDAEGNMRKLPDILGDLDNSLSDLNQEEKTGVMKTIFDSYTITAGNILIGDSAKKWGEFNDKVGAAPGVAAQAEDRLKGMMGSIEQLKGTLETGAIMLGSVFLPVVTKGIQGVTAGLGSLLEFDWGPITEMFSGAGQRIGEAFTKGVEVIRVAFDLLRGGDVGEGANRLAEMLGIDPAQAQEIAAIISGIGDKVREFADYLTGTVAPAIRSSLLDTWADIQPVVQRVFDDIVKLAAWLVGQFTEKWPTIKATAQETFEALGAAIKGIMEEVGPTLNAVVGHVERIVSEIAERWDQIKPIVEPVLQFVVDTIQRLMDTASNIIQLVMNIIQGDWSGAWENIKTIVSNVWDQIVSIISTMQQVLPAAVALIWGLIKDAAGLAWDGIKALVNMAWDALLAYAKAKAEDLRADVVAKFNELKGNATDIWEQIKAAITGKVDDIRTGITDKMAEIRGALAGPFEWFRDNIGGVMKSAANNLVQPLRDAINGMETFGNAIVKAVNWVSNNLGLGNVIGGSLSLGNIPQFAAGGKMKEEGLAKVGEAGWEYVWLPQGAQVFTHQESMNLARMKAQAQTDAFPEEWFETYREAQGGLPGLDTVRSAVSNAARAVGSQVKGFVKEWVGKGAEALVGKAFDAAGVESPKLPGELKDAGGKVFAAIRDQVVETVKTWLTAAKESVGTGDWTKPLQGYSITQEFGPASGENGYTFHTGIDLAAGMGTPIVAANDATSGVSRDAGSVSYGLHAILQHAEGLSTLYGHMSSVAGNLSNLMSGDPVGGVGSTGNSTGPHVHFEILEGGTPVDPRKYIAFARGGRITERILGVGTDTGTRYEFGEAGDEWVIPATGGGSSLGADGAVPVVWTENPEPLAVTVVNFEDDQKAALEYERRRAIGEGFSPHDGPPVPVSIAAVGGEAASLFTGPGAANEEQRYGRTYDIPKLGSLAASVLDNANGILGLTRVTLQGQLKGENGGTATINISEMHPGDALQAIYGSTDAARAAIESAMGLPEENRAAWIAATNAHIQALEIANGDAEVLRQLLLEYAQRVAPDGPVAQVAEAAADLGNGLQSAADAMGLVVGGNSSTGPAVPPAIGSEPVPLPPSLEVVADAFGASVETFRLAVEQTGSLYSPEATAAFAAMPPAMQTFVGQLAETGTYATELLTGFPDVVQDALVAQVDALIPVLEPIRESNNAAIAAAEQQALNVEEQEAATAVLADEVVPALQENAVQDAEAVTDFGESVAEFGLGVENLADTIDESSPAGGEIPADAPAEVDDDEDKPMTAAEFAQIMADAEDGDINPAAYAGGGLIRRKSLLSDAATGVIYGTMAEAGPEWIVNQAQMAAMARGTGRNGDHAVSQNTYNFGTVSRPGDVIRMAEATQRRLGRELLRRG